VGIERRDIGIAVILSIVTCGIYSLYWYYKMIDDLYRINGLESKAGMDLILSLVTCGIYYIYMYYKMGVLLRDASGGRNDDKPILFLLLALFTPMVFFLVLVANCIIQSELNNYFADNGDGGSSGQMQ
jgi:hypothetical protein